MGTIPEPHSPDTDRHWVGQTEGKSSFHKGPNGSFTFVSSRNTDVRQYLRLDSYSAAKAFVEGKFDVRGDLIAAIRYFFKQPHSEFRTAIYSLLARLEHLRIYSLFGTPDDAISNAQYHYDRSNEFYSLFLDSRLTYSSAYFEKPNDSLDTAQYKKLEMICQDLALQRGEEFLDVGCGWGGLVVHAAEQHGVRAHGCTVAKQQLTWAEREIQKRGLQSRASISLCDYREISGAYDKIASVGMFEHVGKGRLFGYFKKMHGLLRTGGVLLNRGVVRPHGVHDGPETFFLQKSVFPGGELAHLGDVVREGERAGFEAIGLRDTRIHYGLTCQAWVNNLQRNADRCRAIVGDRTYRTWLLYLAASAVSFEDGRTGAAQILFRKLDD